MLNADHEGHTGSLHVLEASSGDEAKAFAFNEPYFLAGLYERVEVVAFESWLDESMWARPGDRTAGRSWLAVWRNEHPAASSDARDQLSVPDSVLCAGWMFDIETSACLGAVATFDAPDAMVASVTGELSARAWMSEDALWLVPWRRGGRQ